MAEKSTSLNLTDWLALRCGPGHCNQALAVNAESGNQMRGLITKSGSKMEFENSFRAEIRVPGHTPVLLDVSIHM